MDSLNIRRFGTVLGRLLIAVLAVLLLGVLTALPALAAGSGTWTLTSSLNVARADFTTTFLQNGQILVVGGRNSNYTPLASAELYNPSTGTWTTTGSLHTARVQHTATLLQNGQVLVAAGYNQNNSPPTLPVRNSTTPPQGSGRTPAACTPRGGVTRRPCCKTAKCWSLEVKALAPAAQPTSSPARNSTIPPLANGRLPAV